MPSQSELIYLTPKERREYGFLRVRDAAFDAVSALWQRRQNEGMTQVELATAIGGDAGWVSRNLRGPGNWTMKTFGAFVEALNGEAQIAVRAAEDRPAALSNFHAYVGYESEIPATTNEISATLQTASGNRQLSGPVSSSAAILIP
jgi:transcriptional regulator with XRE-family HTH domain